MEHEALTKATEALEPARAALASTPPMEEPVMWAFQYADGTWHNASETEHSGRMSPLYASPHVVATPEKPAMADLKNWSLLATCALDDCRRVLNAVDAESSEERKSLVELYERVESLCFQSLTLHDLMNRKQLEQQLTAPT